MKYEKIVNTPKSRNSVRYVPLNKTALDALVKIHSIMGDNDRIVTTENGLLVDPSAIHRTMSRILKNCGFNGKKDIVHALRHTFATLLLRQGTDIKVVSEILGHSDVSKTVNTSKGHTQPPSAIFDTNTKVQQTKRIAEP